MFVRFLLICFFFFFCHGMVPCVSHFCCIKERKLREVEGGGGGWVGLGCYLQSNKANNVTHMFYIFSKKTKKKPPLYFLFFNIHIFYLCIITVSPPP